VGVVVTLFATGVLNLGSSSSAPTGPTPTTNATTQQLYDRVEKIVQKQLGPGYPNSNRLIWLGLQQVRLPSGIPDIPYPLQNYHSLYIEYWLLDHPLRAWRLRTAKAEVFSLLRALYISGLPIYNVELDGRFSFLEKGHMRQEQALYVDINRATANSIPWRRWGREHEGQLWKMLPYKSVDPRFA
jgi:hypothetical protein